MKKIHLNGRITIQPDQILIDGGSFGVEATPGGTILKVPGDLVYDGVIDGGSFDPPTPKPTNNGEGKRQQRRRRITAAEAEILVRDILRRYEKKHSTAITRDAIAAALNISTGMVSQTAAWRAFRDRRKAHNTQPNDSMLSVISDKHQTEQAADMHSDREE